jgi:hypothetical protein
MVRYTNGTNIPCEDRCSQELVSNGQCNCFQPNKSILKLIQLQYSGEELEYQLQAWSVYPTLKTDCTIKALEKAALRAKFVKELKASKVN